MKRNDLYFAIKKDISSIEIAIDYLDLVNTQSDHDNRNLQRAISHLKETKKNLENLIGVNKKESSDSLLTK